MDQRPWSAGLPSLKAARIQALRSRTRGTVLRSGWPSSQEAELNERISLSAVEVGLHVRLVQLDREVAMRARQVSQVRREEARNPLAGGHAHHAAGVIPEGHPATVDGGGGVGHALRHRQQVLAPLRQPMTIRGALEQARAQALLELT